MYPTLFRMTPDDRVHYTALIKLLQHFGWNWVGILTAWDGSGDEEAQELSKMMSQHGICTEYIFQIQEVFKNDIQRITFINDILGKSTAKVVIVCGTATMYFFTPYMSSILNRITLIFPPSWNKLYTMNDKNSIVVNCSFLFFWPQQMPVNFNIYPHGFHVSGCLNDPIMEDLWLYLFHCLTPNEKKNALFYLMYSFLPEFCTSLIDVSFIFAGHTSIPSYAYMAVYVLAYALHDMYYMKKIQKTQKHNGFQHRLHKYVRHVYYENPYGGDIYFNERREVPSNLILHNWLLVNASFYLSRTISIMQGPDYIPKTFINISDPVYWKKGKVTVSRCSDPCIPGTRKKFGSSIHKCCYECISCPEGEISNISDSENCMKCPDEEWPNEKKDRCVPRLVEFLSYTDTIVVVFSTVSILCCLLTGLIWRIFIHYQDTPIVKANNRNLSYLLLVSIMLSFLCVFLFLGHPVDVTCMLRVTSFGVIFSVGVSSLLAKSIMVCIAFKATKPGSPWRKWMGAKLPTFIICVLSLVQVIICVTWLSISPPFQDQDTHSYRGKVIIQCNEGSVIGFYSVLGYMGLLAAVSFIIAFLARTLPDSFNEAKYITFSMLVFCSVWIAMIPAYLSTRGKYMVAVEIFAIIASSSGLLGCIFFPKCYIILFRPDLNTKTFIH
ncbi:vomeronasal type-2 receptor 116-like [Aquarana catesbeiana]|uniref:vomeronasal type-2 receptor 116-like n=1 Tax=Aquarana catesbeiana TaxID=8400 RepID=UPI003CC94F71